MSTHDILSILINRYDLEVSSVVGGSHYLKNEFMYVLLIEPHDYIGYKFLLRADYPETFDRWSVCLFEELFDAGNLSNVLVELDNFVENREENIKLELESN